MEISNAIFGVTLLVLTTALIPWLCRHPYRPDTHCVCNACNAVYTRPQGDLTNFFCRRCERHELRPARLPGSRPMTYLATVTFAAVFGGCLAGPAGALTAGWIAMAVGDRP